ncbi:Uma2 family endonuclease [Nocardia carnea]|uniref:Uma2 family endonuclease n=1 Tax=Nocardia carnea TaxID=37328 RepID=UPI00245541E7|nr:Uma2 family endonuclease [Nocardia carnea]
MTLSHGSLMTVDEFEELDAAAQRISEGLRLEYLNGLLAAKARPDVNHSRVIQWLARFLVPRRSELWLFADRGLRAGRSGGSRVRPDAILAPASAFAGEGEWSDPQPVLMTIEVTSRAQHTELRDRLDKPFLYAATAIPLYLLIDRGSAEINIFSEPDDGRYASRVTLPFGTDIEIPDPLNVILATDPLLDWT